jgi:predicted nucleic acid-binding protein
MDVVLDSNIFISDFRMRSPRFLGLFDYLRKTRSMLQIPDIVYEEVVAKYRRDLSDKVRTLNKCVNDVKAKLLSDKPFVLENKKLLNEPETWIKAQCDLLESRLDTPAKNVHGNRFTNISAIDLREVYMRGIDRVPPASEQGEELRDVILWLSVIELGKMGKQVTFITGDSGFWDGTEIKPRLRRDIEEAGTKILMYRSVEDFVKEHAPAAEEASPQWVAKHKIDLTQDDPLIDSILDEISSTVEKALPNRTVRKLSVADITLKKGLLYRTGEHKQFAELTYSGVVSGIVEKKRDTNVWFEMGLALARDPQALRQAESTRQYVAQESPILFEMDTEFVVDAYVENDVISGLELDFLRGADIRFPDVEKS